MALECPRGNSSKCLFDLTHHLVSVQETHSVIDNWTMVTADQTGCCDLGLMTGMTTYIQKQEHPMALIPPSAPVFQSLLIVGHKPLRFLKRHCRLFAVNPNVSRIEPCLSKSILIPSGSGCNSQLSYSGITSCPGLTPSYHTYFVPLTELPNGFRAHFNCHDCVLGIIN